MSKGTFVLLNGGFLWISLAAGCILTIILGVIASLVVYIATTITLVIVLKIVWWITAITSIGCVLYLIKSWLYNLLRRRNMEMFSDSNDDEDEEEDEQ